jgi:hypothetical protein
MAGKKVAIVQSNYIPWKGYFDLIASADEFILYDDVQFTKNDWRNRNKIKSPRGLEWLSIPVGQNIKRRIRDVALPDTNWRQQHWNKLHEAYHACRHYNQVAAVLAPFYQSTQIETLTEFNRALIEAICDYLGINTKISYTWDYPSSAGKTERLVDLCRQTGAVEYISGPAAKAYLNESLFTANGIDLHWFDYCGYPQYTQLFGEFEHRVSVVDLLFNCGTESPNYMKHVLA